LGPIRTFGLGQQRFDFSTLRLLDFYSSKPVGCRGYDCSIDNLKADPYNLPVDSRWIGIPETQLSTAVSALQQVKTPLRFGSPWSRVIRTLKVMPEAATDRDNVM
jgi:hypothetical protein